MSEAVQEAPARHHVVVKERITIQTENIDFYYSAESHALKDVTIQIPYKKVTAFIADTSSSGSIVMAI